jgi:hypothetical protein
MYQYRWKQAMTNDDLNENFVTYPKQDIIRVPPTTDSINDKLKNRIQSGRCHI